MKRILFIAALFILIWPGVSSAEVKIGFVSGNIWLSAERPLAGDNVKIYSIIVNSDEKQVEGEVLFYDNDIAIGSPISFSLAAGGTSRVVSVNWIAAAGNHRFKAVIANAASVSDSGARTAVAGNVASETEVIFVDVDSDNDGLPDGEEASAGTNPESADTDGDGEGDKEDPAPLDSKITSGPDTDKDGASDKVDTDIDNDGLYNWEEEKLLTDPAKYDTDGDGVGDKEDAYPTEAGKWEKEIAPAVSSAVAGEPEIAEESEEAEGDVLGEKIYTTETDGGAEQNKEIKFLTSGRIVKSSIILAVISAIAALVLLFLSRKKSFY